MWSFLLKLNKMSLRNMTSCLQPNNLDSDLQCHPAGVILRSRYFEIHQWRQKVCLSPVTTREHLDNKWDVDRWGYGDRDIPKQCQIEFNSSIFLQNRGQYNLRKRDFNISWVKKFRWVLFSEENKYSWGQIFRNRNKQFGLCFGPILKSEDRREWGWSKPL